MVDAQDYRHRFTCIVTKQKGNQSQIKTETSKQTSALEKHAQEMAAINQDYKYKRTTWSKKLNAQRERDTELILEA